MQVTEKTVNKFNNLNPKVITSAPIPWLLPKQTVFLCLKARFFIASIKSIDPQLFVKFYYTHKKKFNQ